MTVDQIRALLITYEIVLREAGAVPVRDREKNPSKEIALSHAYWMCSFIQTDLLNDLQVNDAKVGRWLGFIQGVLWTHNIYSIDEMKDHNR